MKWLVVAGLLAGAIVLALGYESVLTGSGSPDVAKTLLEIARPHAVGGAARDLYLRAVEAFNEGDFEGAARLAIKALQHGVRPGSPPDVDVYLDRLRLVEELASRVPATDERRRALGLLDEARELVLRREVAMAGRALDEAYSIVLNAIDRESGLARARLANRLLGPAVPAELRGFVERGALGLRDVVSVARDLERLSRVGASVRLMAPWGGGLREILMRLSMLVLDFSEVARLSSNVTDPEVTRAVGLAKTGLSRLFTAVLRAGFGTPGASIDLARDAANAANESLVVARGLLQRLGEGPTRDLLLKLVRVDEGIIELSRMLVSMLSGYELEVGRRVTIVGVVLGVLSDGRLLVGGCVAPCPGPIVKQPGPSVVPPRPGFGLTQVFIVDVSSAELAVKPRQGATVGVRGVVTGFDGSIPVVKAEKVEPLFVIMPEPAP